MSPDRTTEIPGLTRRAPAKINLCLEVRGKRDDGYHELRTVMQTVGLCDEIRYQPRDDGRIILHASSGGLPPAEENLVYRAASRLQKQYRPGCGVEIELTKNIPIGAGLGGGSSDCATTLMGLCEVWNLDTAPQDLREIGADLGSDVPFFIPGGTALCEGRGEKVTALQCDHEFHYALILPDFGVSTAEVYSRVPTTLTKSGSGTNISNVEKALRVGDARLLGRALHNDLETPAFSANPQIKQVSETIGSLLPHPGCHGFCLSGSGSAFFAVCEGEHSCLSLVSRTVGEGLHAIPVSSVQSQQF
ncbi:MAG: 4-(cytidine 5'-diphospho)-2-C-methyl-D-erythritol kinase [Candidatus Brocadiia bacterium]